MKLLVIAAVLSSHLSAAYPLFKSLNSGKMPRTVDFACLSLIIFYDIGLLVETFSHPDYGGYFTPLFDANEKVQFKTLIVLFLAPWLFHLGSIITDPRFQPEQEKFYSNINRNANKLFYLIVISISIYLAFISGESLLQGNSLWANREEITSQWGPFVIIFYLPLYFLAFYVRQNDSADYKGLLFSLFLVVATIFATLNIAQRTNILVPILILVLFRKKITTSKLILFSILIMIVAASLLPLFKWQYQSSTSTIELLTATVNNDVSRISVLTTVIEKSTRLEIPKIIPYPMAGYIYSALFYFPRSMVPFKGRSTADYFTSYIASEPLESISWGFAFGAIEEIILNLGFSGFLPGMIIYGLCMGSLDRLSLRIPSFIVPTRLGAIWICGYTSTSILLTFVTMGVVCWIFHILFVEKQRELKILKY